MLSLALLSLLGSFQDPRPQPAPARPQNEFNPTITVFADVLWRLDNKAVVEEEDGDVIAKDDKFLLREIELDFRAAIDPYADGVLILAAHEEVPGEHEIDIEEGYVRIKSLPFGFWEEPPLGLSGPMNATTRSGQSAEKLAKPRPVAPPVTTAWRPRKSSWFISSCLRRPRKPAP